MATGSNETFDLIFTGELVPGHELAQVRASLAELFRIPPDQVDKLFNNAPVTLKRNVDSEAANRYRVAVKKAGARLSTQVHQQTAAPAPPARPSATSATAAVGTPPAPAPAPAPADSALQTALGAQPARPLEPRQPIQAPDFKVAPAGSRLVEPAPASAPAATAPAWDLAAAGGFLLRDDEREIPVAAADAPEFQVAPVGAAVLEGYEPPPLPEVELDLSHLSLAAAGARLGAVPPPPPAPPSTDHLRLK